jgi:hypothetical protein
VKIKNEVELTIPMFFAVEVLKSVSKRLKPIIHIHHCLGIEKIVEIIINEEFKKIFYFVHDYYIFTTLLHLFDKRIQKPISLEQAKNLYPNKAIHDYRIYIEKVTLFVCPSFSVGNRIKQYVPKNKVKVLYHPELNNPEAIKLDLVKVKIADLQNFNVLILGNFGEYKGERIVKQLLKDFAHSKYKLKFYHLGNPIENLSAENYFSLGTYSKDNFIPKLSNLSLALCWLPFQTEETYSFTLSDALLTQLPIVASKVGAVNERLRNRNFTTLISNFTKSDSHKIAILKLAEKMVSSDGELPTSSNVRLVRKIEEYYNLVK